MRQWYALRSKPKRELSAAQLLSRANIQVYVPQVTVPRPFGRPPTLAPFFPGYFFGQLDPDLGEVHMARYTSGVVDVVGYGGQPWPVPEGLIDAIRERLDRSQGRPYVPEFTPGDRVTVTDGPLKDMEAIFHSHLSAAGRVRVLIHLLRRLCPAEVHVGQLRLASKAAGNQRTQG